MTTADSKTKKRRRVASQGEGRRSSVPSFDYEEVFRFLVDNIDDHAIFCTGPGGKIAIWNAGATRVFGYDEAEIKGRPLSLLCSPEDNPTRTPDQELDTTARRGGVRKERWYLRKDGSRFFASGLVAPLHDSAGQLCGHVHVYGDKTRWSHAQEEQEQLLLREREARQQAEKSSRLQDEFVATVSHELRTPLNAILGWVDILRTQKLDVQTTVHAVEVIRRNAKAQKQHIEDLLDVSQIITGKLRLDTRPLELETVVNAAVDTIRLAAEAKAIRIRERLAHDAGWVLGDSGRLQQIVWNLLSNAVKFTPKGGHVDIFLRRRDSSVELSVSDTGQGIAPEFVSSLFERFRQADASTTRVHAGLGLGLALARHLTELHGGTIRAESAGAGKGATFTLTLPRSPLQESQQESSAPEEKHAWDEVSRLLPSLEGLRLLVVDDEPDAREFLSFILLSRGAKVSSACSAREALECLQREPCDVLISDIGMLNEDGYQLLRKVRALPADRGGRIPAIALTAYGREQDRVRSLVAGFQSHVVKPVKTPELIAVVAQLAGRLGGKSPGP